MCLSSIERRNFLGSAVPKVSVIDDILAQAETRQTVSVRMEVDVEKTIKTRRLYHIESFILIC